MDEPIPDDLRIFILKYIDSIAQLEALLLMRETPARSWDVPALAKRLYTGEQEVAELAARLHADGFLVSADGGYRYQPATPELRSAVEKLAQFYSKQLIPVTALIHAKPRRIREFADAFKFRKDR